MVYKGTSLFATAFSRSPYTYPRLLFRAPVLIEICHRSIMGKTPRHQVASEKVSTHPYHPRQQGDKRASRSILPKPTLGQGDIYRTRSMESQHQIENLLSYPHDSHTRQYPPPISTMSTKSSHPSYTVPTETRDMAHSYGLGYHHPAQVPQTNPDVESERIAPWPHRDLSQIFIPPFSQFQESSFATAPGLLPLDGTYPVTSRKEAGEWMPFLTLSNPSAMTNQEWQTPIDASSTLSGDAEQSSQLIHTGPYQPPVLDTIRSQAAYRSPAPSLGSDPPSTARSSPISLQRATPPSSAIRSPIPPLGTTPPSTRHWSPVPVQETTPSPGLHWLPITFRMGPCP